MVGTILLVTLSCSLFTGRQPATETPARQAVPGRATAQIPEAPTPEAAQETPAAQTAAPEVTVTAALQSCVEPVCILDGTFLLHRPIGPEGRQVIDSASRYGTLRRRIRDVYHGVQFLNSTGTPVYAAAAGDVIVAGDDSQVSYGPRPNMYGNLVILKHSLPGVPDPVYTLYANLSDIAVKAEGDVEAGEQIGSVGMSGSVRGSTLTFEVRLGENTYQATRNPELWLEPIADATGDPTGAIAGRVLDKQGRYVDIRNILVQTLRAPGEGRRRPLYLRTYLEDDQTGLSPYGESFAAGDLPEGTYKVSFWYGPNLYERVVEVQPGMLTFLNFEV
jgi:murein DD-endopeptidase MepM/ murein hydrolase activator NlpD